MNADASPTPVAKKLGLNVGNRLLLVHAPPAWSVADPPEDVVVTRRSTAARADVVVAFFTQLTTLRHELDGLSHSMTVNGSLWVAWPRRAGGHVSDITDNEVRAVALPLGLVDVKVAALDDDWSSLKFVWRKELRPGLS